MQRTLILQIIITIYTLAILPCQHKIKKDLYHKINLQCFIREEGVTQLLSNRIINNKMLNRINSRKRFYNIRGMDLIIIYCNNHKEIVNNNLTHNNFYNSNSNNSNSSNNSPEKICLQLSQE